MGLYTETKAASKVGEALKRLAALPPQGQEAIASMILDTLDSDLNPAAQRFQELVERQYLGGLSPGENAELHRLEAGFRKSDALFYEPILNRMAASANGPVRRKSPLGTT